MRKIVLSAIWAVSVTSVIWADEAVDASCAEAYSDFAFRLFDKAASTQEGKNLVLSPLSLQLAMSMVENGASGATLDQIQEVFGTQGFSLKQLNAYNKQLMEEKLQPKSAEELGYKDENIASYESSKPQVAFVTGIWLQQGCSFYEHFKETASSYYQTQTESVDFGQSSTYKDIDQWVCEKTNGLIPSLQLTPNQALKMILVNALYFKGTWARKYTSLDEQKFTDAKGDSLLVPTVHFQSSFPILESEDFQMCRMSYVGKFSMTFFLPKREDSHQLYAAWKQMQASTSKDNTTAYIQIPRFHIGNEIGMNAILKGMGMEDAFDKTKADFSLLTGEKLSIDELKQICNINVNEKGTEASAATSAGITSVGYRKSFIADRPFYFTIEDSPSGTVLFIGQVNKIDNGNAIASIKIENEVSAIPSVMPETSDIPIYDLAGRRLQQTPQRGLYIQGGKKYLVK